MLYISPVTGADELLCACCSGAALLSSRDMLLSRTMRSEGGLALSDAALLSAGAAMPGHQGEARAKPLPSAWRRVAAKGLLRPALLLSHLSAALTTSGYTVNLHASLEVTNHISHRILEKISAQPEGLLGKLFIPLSGNMSQD